MVTNKVIIPLFASQLPRTLPATSYHLVSRQPSIAISCTVARENRENRTGETRGISLFIADQREREVDRLDDSSHDAMPDDALRGRIQRAVQHIAVASRHETRGERGPKSAWQILRMSESKESHRLQLFQCRFRYATLDERTQRYQQN